LQIAWNAVDSIDYTWTMPEFLLLVDALPELAHELDALLTEKGETGLAAQIPELRIVDRCRCGKDFCATFYTQPNPESVYDCIQLAPEQGMLIVDYVEDKIVSIEPIFRDDIRQQLHAIMP
jgi:hypothetical protein